MILLLLFVSTAWECIISVAQETSASWRVMTVIINIKVQCRNLVSGFLTVTRRKRQYILFPGIGDVKAGVESVTLRATSDCGLPVYYYVKEGPAEIDGNKLVFTPIPPRSKYPLKVTVVAWQYGLAGKVQTAEPIERSFFIYQ